MKTLIIVRHAKAEVLPSNKTDFDRKLTDSGKNDAEKMALILSKKIKCPDVFISSTAKRAWSTAKRFAKAFSINESEIQAQKKIFEAHADTLINLVENIDNKHQVAIIFGHNPGFLQLAFYFSGNEAMELPTCGLVIIEFDINEWQNVAYKNGKLTYFDRP
jgi:phosphohistidine phosphatase